MEWKRLAIAGLTVGLALGSAGCTDGYGYSGVSVGYGSGYGYDDGYYNDGYYGDPYYAGGYGNYGNGYGYAPSYFGWYDNFYYPGTGIYVYDNYRRRYRWNDRQRHYWESRRGRQRGHENWGGFQHRPPQGYYRGNPNEHRGDGYRPGGEFQRGRSYQGSRNDQGYRRRNDNAPRYSPPATGQAPSPTYLYQGRTNGNWQSRSRSSTSQSHSSSRTSSGRPHRD